MLLAIVDPSQGTWLPVIRSNVQSSHNRFGYKELILHKLFIHQLYKCSVMYFRPLWLILSGINANKDESALHVKCMSRAFSCNCRIFRFLEQILFFHSNRNLWCKATNERCNESLSMCRWWRCLRILTNLLIANEHCKQTHGSDTQRENRRMMPFEIVLSHESISLAGSSIAYSSHYACWYINEGEW